MRNEGFASLTNFANAGQAPSASVLQETAQKAIGAIEDGSGMVRNDPSAARAGPDAERSRCISNPVATQCSCDRGAELEPGWLSAEKSNEPAPATRSL